VGHSRVDPSAAAASRRAEFLGMRAAAEFFLWLSRIFQTFQPAEYFSAQNSARTYSVV